MQCFYSETVYIKIIVQISNMYILFSNGKEVAELRKFVFFAFIYVI